jgi:hypothetical protein
VTELCLIRHSSCGLSPVLGTTVKDDPSGFGGVLLVAQAWEFEGCSCNWFCDMGVNQCLLGLVAGDTGRSFDLLDCVGGR